MYIKIRNKNMKQVRHKVRIKSTVNVCFSQVKTEELNIKEVH